MHDSFTKDITKLKSLPECDLFCSGFPCVTFSSIGKREGTNDPRGKIFYYIRSCKTFKRFRKMLFDVADFGVPQHQDRLNIISKSKTKNAYSLHHSNYQNTYLKPPSPASWGTQFVLSSSI